MAARAIAFTVTGFFVFGAVVAMLSAAGSPTAGKTLAIVILSAPLVMLLLAGASRLIALREPAGREPGARPQQTALNEQARTFLFIAGFAALCVVVLVVHAELRAETGFADAVAWIVLLAFVASVPVGLVVLFGLMLVPTAQLWLRSIAGPRKDFFRGALHITKCEFSEATQAYDRYRPDFPDDSRGTLGNAYILAVEGRYDEALRDTHRAVLLERRPETFDLRGRLLFRAGALVEALADGEAALALNPRLAAARDLVGALLVTARLLDRAIDLMESGGLSQTTAASRFALAEAYRLRGDHDLARKYYAQAAKLAPFYVKFDPRHSEGLWACALAELGRWEEADRHIQHTLGRNASDTTALYARALHEKEMGDLDALEQTLKEMLVASLGLEVVGVLTDPQFTPLLDEKRFRELLAWALGAQRQARERVLAQRNTAP